MAFHTFQTTNPANETGNDQTPRPAASSRITTSNACQECRRRKIRCDGQHPCGQCQGYQYPRPCLYVKPNQRIVPSRKLIHRLQVQADQSSVVLSKLFPGKDVAALAELPRDDLINLVLGRRASTSASSEMSSKHMQSSATSDDVESLEELEHPPDQDPVTDEAKRHRNKIQGISDDVNGLALSLDKHSSYVGISSILAALKVILKTAPWARHALAQNNVDTALPSRASSPRLRSCEVDPDYLPPAHIGNQLIESYFARVDVLMPMIDKDQFCHTYLYGTRRDSPWLALLNMVFTLGSLAGSTCEDQEHIAYFQRAKRHIDLETFGSSSILVLQALGLLSGYYLHWLNRPNEANSLMGATLRMATALSLHREFDDRRPVNVAQSASLEASAETRRRTWWTLVYLDTLASMTTGRPSLGRLGSGVTTRGPRIPEQTNNAQYLASLRLLPIVHNVAFCKLASKVQDRLASRPLSKLEELYSLDVELLRWHEELPPVLHAIPHGSTPTPRRQLSTLPGADSPSAVSTVSLVDSSQLPEYDQTSCPEVLVTPRAIMHWWFLTLRMLLHRPFLLAAALRHTPVTTSDERAVAVNTCRAIAAQTIRDIDNTCQDTLVAGWNAVWLMHQAVMVPLISLFSLVSIRTSRAHMDDSDMLETGMGTEDDETEWRSQIATAVAFFSRMQRYSVAAARSRDVVIKLLDVSMQAHQACDHNASHHLHQQSDDGERVFTSSQDGAGGDYMTAHDQLKLASDPTVPRETIDEATQGLVSIDEQAMLSIWDDMLWDDLPDFEGLLDATTTDVGHGY